MDLISAESLWRPEVKRWHKRIMDGYRPPEGVGLAVLLPCSARKPYSKSKSHMAYRAAIKAGAGSKRGMVHELIMTSPLGLVPRELEKIYPAAHYDVVVTGVWSEEEKEFTKRLITDYQGKSPARIVAFAEGAYEGICQEQEIEYATDLDGLEKLVRRELENMEAERGFSRGLADVRAVCDYQFGQGAFEAISKDGLVLKGLQVKTSDGMLLATFERRSGLLSLTLLGGKMLSSLNRYHVTLSFRPEMSNVFCAGVEEAHRGIRPRDEVIVFFEDEVVGVGKTLLPGHEMVRAGKGLALTLRHRRK